MILHLVVLVLRRLVLRNCRSTRRMRSGGSEETVTLMLSFFRGIGLGSLLCERLSGHEVEIGFVRWLDRPHGFCSRSLLATPGRPLPCPSSAPFVRRQGGGGPPDLGLIGIFGGLFIVPLYALVQQRSRREVISRVIGAQHPGRPVHGRRGTAGAAALETGLTIPQLLLRVWRPTHSLRSISTELVPEVFLRFIAWLLVHFIYRRIRGLETFPTRPAS